MSTRNGAAAPSSPTYFDQQRAVLVNNIAVVSLPRYTCIQQNSNLTQSQNVEHVLQNMNKLNRSLEGVIAVRRFRILPVQAKNPDIQHKGRKRVQPSRRLMVAIRERDGAARSSRRRTRGEHRGRRTKGRTGMRYPDTTRRRGTMVTSLRYDTQARARRQKCNRNYYAYGGDGTEEDEK